MLRTKGIWAIAPKIEGDFIYVPIAVNYGNYGKFTLIDPDTSMKYLVEIGKSKGSDFLVKETWWLLLEVEDPKT